MKLHPFLVICLYNYNYGSLKIYLPCKNLIEYDKNDDLHRSVQVRISCMRPVLRVDLLMWGNRGCVGSLPIDLIFLEQNQREY